MYTSGDFIVNAGTLEILPDHTFQAKSNEKGNKMHPESRSHGYFELLKKVPEKFYFSVDVKRITEDKGRPIELYVIGGCFAISEKGKYYRYESEEHRSDRIASDAIKQDGRNTIAVEQHGKTLQGRINGVEIGKFVLNQEENKQFSDHHVGVFFKGDPEFSSEIHFKDIKLDFEE